MSDVFISHVEEDAEIALQIALRLENEGYHTWCYEAKRKPGQDYRKEVNKAIMGCKVVLLIISRNSLKSENISIELHNASAAGKHFVPLCHGVTYDEFIKLKPQWLGVLGGAQAIDIDGRKISTTIEQIVKGLSAFGIGQSSKPDAQSVKDILNATDALPKVHIRDKFRRMLHTRVFIAASVIFITAAIVAITIVFFNTGGTPPPTPSTTSTPAPTTALTPTTTPTPVPTTTVTSGTTSTPTPTIIPTTIGYGFESGNTTGWQAEIQEPGSLAVSAVSASDEAAKLGVYSLKLSVNLVGGDASKSKGEVYIDLRYNQQLGLKGPVDMDGVRTTCWVLAPPEAVGDPQSPNGIQVFVKDINWKGEYGAWTNIVGGSWFQVSLAPSASKPEGGYIDVGFDPTNIVSVGVKIAAGSKSTATYVGPVYLDEFRWHPPFYVYADASAPQNHFVPEGWIGCSSCIHIDENYQSNVFRGASCIRIDYVPQPENAQKWAGVYWWDPPDSNWCEKSGGFDLSKWTKLTFWARGDRGGEVAEFKVGGLQNAKGVSCDSLQPAITTHPPVLTTAWTKYTISLYGQDLSHIAAGFVWVTDSNQEATIYLDEIRFEWDESG